MAKQKAAGLTVKGKVGHLRATVRGTASARITKNLIVGARLPRPRQQWRE
jgi:hypothetical protein